MGNKTEEILKEAKVYGYPNQVGLTENEARRAIKLTVHKIFEDIEKLSIEGDYNIPQQFVIELKKKYTQLERIRK